MPRRSIDIPTAAFILFAFVVVALILSVCVVGIACRVFDRGCFADQPDAVRSVTGWIDTLIAILLALMTGRRAGPPPDKD
jgi:hypothetical protein